MPLRTAARRLPMPPAAGAPDGGHPHALDEPLLTALAVALTLQVDDDARAAFQRMIARAESACPPPSGDEAARRISEAFVDDTLG